jgi:serine/threonine-protein kinase
MGVVLSARHEDLGHQVAIKVLASEDEITNTAVERFLREGRAVASLQSDHVVRIYDVGRLDSGVPFMVMELLRGQDLGTYMATSELVGAEQAVDWVLQASSAIAEAHERGIIHRDLKPSNLFLTQRSDGSDCVKVLDFGISKRVTLEDFDQYKGTLTSTRQVVGSPAYMLPEQVRNARDIDHRVDIWALGMTLYELLTGRTAFDADTFPAVCAAIVTDTPPPLREITPDIPAELEQIVLQCLEKDPTRRFTSVNALAKALRPFGSPEAHSTARAASRSSRRDARSSREEDSSTLVSPGSNSRARNRVLMATPRDDLVKADRTMNSARAEAHALPNASNALRSRITTRQLSWLILIVCGFSVGTIWKFKVLYHTARVPTELPTPARNLEDSARFLVTFESKPSGANVWDGSILLGTAPFTLSVERATVRSSPRKFVLHREGYEPFVVFQGDTSHNVDIVANLIASKELPTSTVRTESAPPKRAARISEPAALGSSRSLGTTSNGDISAPSDIRSNR